MTRNHNGGGSTGCLNSTAAIIGAIAALITAVAGLIVAIHGNNGGNGGYQPPPSPPTISPQPIGSFCCDLNGLRRCPLATSLPVGAYCFCPYQGNGFTCQ